MMFSPVYSEKNYHQRSFPLTHVCLNEISPKFHLFTLGIPFGMIVLMETIHETIKLPFECLKNCCSNKRAPKRHPLDFISPSEFFPESKIFPSGPQKTHSYEVHFSNIKKKRSWKRTLLYTGATAIALSALFYIRVNDEARNYLADNKLSQFIESTAKSIEESSTYKSVKNFTLFTKTDGTNFPNIDFSWITKYLPSFELPSLETTKNISLTFAGLLTILALGSYLFRGEKEENNREEFFRF